MALAVISDTIVTGQLDICLLDQKSAAIITGTNAVYNQIWIGNQANSA